VAIAVLAAVGYWVSSSQDLVLGQRVSTWALQTEIAEARGVIWEDAFKAVRDNPVLGVGFKNFGDEKPAGFDRFGREITVRASAHGVVQDVFTEHGLFLGVMFLLGGLSVAARAFRLAKATRAGSATRALTVLLLTMLVPLLFSSAFVNATPLYLLVVLLIMDGVPESVPVSARKQLRAGRRRTTRLARVRDARC
jgi:O-antigen ligase